MLERQLHERLAASVRQLDSFQKVPDFELIDQDGKKFTQADLLGHVWVADFIFTSCPMQCPGMSRRMRELQIAIHRMPEVRLVSFSVDPEDDTPEVLKKYAKSFMADTAQWFFLTGKPEMIHDIAYKGFMLGFVETSAAEQPEFGRYSHSSKFAVIDKAGLVRSYHDGLGDMAINDIVRDISDLLRSDK